MNKPVVFLKSHVDAYTRKDGVVVQAHDDKRVSSDHAYDRIKAAGGQGVHTTSDGINYAHKNTGSATLAHRDEPDGHRTVSERDLNTHLSKIKGEASGVHHKDLREGDEIQGPDGQKHEYSHTQQGLGRKVVHTAAGHTLPTAKDGTLEGFKKTGTNFADPAPAKPAAEPAAKRAAPTRKPAAADERVNSDDAFDQLGMAGAKNLGSTSSGIGYVHKNTGATELPHRDEPEGHRTVSKKDLDAHLAKLKGPSERKLDPHPNVIGKAEKGDKRTMHFGGKQYHATGKTGHSFHDQTEVAEYEHPETGHRVWRDKQDRVHADSKEEAKKARGG